MFNVDMIIKHIEGSLTGDLVKDILFLEEMSEKYSDHPNSDEILDAISLLSFKCLSSQDQDQYVTEQYQLAKQAYDTKSYIEGLKIVQEIIRKIKPFEKKGTYDISDDLEAIVIYALNKSSIERCRFPFQKLYELKAELHIELKEYELAIESIQKAIQWNPGCLRLYFTLADIYRLANDLERFYQATLNAFPYLCTAEYVAKAYFNIGYYLIEKKDYQNAIAAFALSLNYEENERTYSELSYIQSMINQEIDYPTMNDLQRMSNTYHVPLSLNETILSYIYTFAMQYLSTNRDLAIRLIKTLYGLTKDQSLLGYLN